MGVGSDPGHDIRTDDTSVVVVGSVLFIMVLATLAQDIHYKDGRCDLHRVGMRGVRRAQAFVAIPGFILQPSDHLVCRIRIAEI
jgi:hypothetical protein